jgi:hypothetical protein
MKRAFLFGAAALALMAGPALADHVTGATTISTGAGQNCYVVFYNDPRDAQSHLGLIPYPQQASPTFEADALAVTNWVIEIKSPGTHSFFVEDLPHGKCDDAFKDGLVMRGITTP